MQALLKQLRFELERFGVEPGTIDTLFIGGGTPSTVSPEAYAPLFETIAPFMRPGAEMTTEANPNSATKSWLSGMRALGINRVSFGVQSFDDEKLKFLGRNHSAMQARHAPQLAKEAGIGHISIDLIYGTACDSRKLLEKDLETAFSLPIDHLSAYSLTIEAHTPFSETPQASRDDEDIARWFTAEIAKQFPQYEISSFGTYRCRHNLGYWQYRDYMGVGSGAVGFLKERRFYPTPSIEAYISDPLATEVEHLTPDAIKSEKVLLGMRSVVGVEEGLLSERERERAAHLVEAGKLIKSAQRLCNPDFFLADEIALYLLQ